MMKLKQKKGWQAFLTLSGQASTEKTLDNFYHYLFTPEEKEKIAGRILLTQALLKEKETQRQISENLGISIAKITRGSNALKNISNQLKLFLKKHLLNLSSG